MRTLNLGILAHVDAGKTTLTERLLFTAGAIDHVGSVDAGTTQTDSLDLERERGITIRSAVASFLLGDLAVNLVDTPGHPDFIAEVERVLGVLDGAVLVVSAVEGVQPQTPLLFRALRRLGVPTLIFVNKIDRAGADDGRVLEAMRRRLAPGMVPMGAVRGLGTRAATFEAGADEDAAFRASLTEALAERDDAVLRAYVADGPDLPSPRLRRLLAEQTAALQSIRSSSARPGPAPASRRSRPASRSSCPPGRAIPKPTSPGASSRSNEPPRANASRSSACSTARSGRASASESPATEARTPSRPRSASSPRPARPTAPSWPRARWPGSGASARSASATRSADADAGDAAPRHFPLPTLESVVVARRPEQSGSLRAALNQLAEQDPLINVRQDDYRHEISVSLYGEVQKEVIQATLEREYGIGADFRDTTTICIEWPKRAAEADEVISREDEDEHHRPQLTPQHEPVQGDNGPPGRAAAAGLRGRVPARRRAPADPALRLQDDRRDGRPDGGVRPRGARGGPRGLAGDRLPGHDVGLRLHVAGLDAGRLPAAHPARAGDRARPGRDVGLRAARERGPGAAVRERARHVATWAGSAAGSAASSRRTACRWSTPCCPSGGSATSSTSCRG